ncbi:transglycosylase SLT domain-containing protein [Faucicola boevrei]|uniref:transglycosylase SLT domain-containing protein n=1 Tax=Faucicola boevrei TaxID=346665 RepID=UPI0003723AB8|nr:transglycosylase SLT domain-containing protein [Moraxella boevrei]
MQPIFSNQIDRLSPKRIPSISLKNLSLKQHQFTLKTNLTLSQIAKTNLAESSKSKKPFTKIFKTKHWLKLFGVLSFILPLGYFMASNASNLSSSIFTPVESVSINNDLAQVIANNTLTVATLNDNSLYFGEDGYEHGFGVDVVRGYANKLGVTLNTVVVANETDALNLVKMGQADIALTTAHLPAILSKTTKADAQTTTEFNHISLSCGQDYLSAHGLNQQISLQVPSTSVELSKSANEFLCDSDMITTHQRLAEFYTQNFFDNDYSEQKFAKIIKTNLPSYKTAFQNNAKKHDLDWELLVAMGYQESQLDPEATSPTGVRGLMMLTNDTADAMGVTDRVNPNQSIRGGAKYFNQIQQMFSDVPSADRVWFALASYNMGPQAVKNIQAKLNAQGKNGNSWAQVYRYMAENRASNRRYVQCMHYVTNIRGFLETLKLANPNSANDNFNDKLMVKAS